MQDINRKKCHYKRWNRSKTAEGKSVVNENEWNMEEIITWFTEMKIRWNGE